MRRPASIQNMTFQEYKYHVETADGQYCIKVARHKSVGKHGPVKLAFSKDFRFDGVLFSKHTQ